MGCSCCWLLKAAVCDLLLMCRLFHCSADGNGSDLSIIVCWNDAVITGNFIHLVGTDNRQYHHSARRSDDWQHCATWSSLVIILVRKTQSTKEDGQTSVLSFLEKLHTKTSQWVRFPTPFTGHLNTRRNSYRKRSGRCKETTEYEEFQSQQLVWWVAFGAQWCQNLRRIWLCFETLTNA